MKNLLLIFSIIFAARCSLPEQYYRNVLITDQLKDACPDGYKKLKRNWAKHKEGNCFWVSNKYRSKGLENILNSCLSDLKMTEVQEVLGKSSRMKEATDSVYYRFDIYWYYMSTHSSCVAPEWQIQFYVDPKTNDIDHISTGIHSIH